MQVLLINRPLGVGRRVILGPLAFFLFALFLLLTAAVLFKTGLKLGAEARQTEAVSRVLGTVMSTREEVTRERARADAARREMETGLDALRLQVGRLQAHVIRLDALGGRLVKVAGLDAEEFGFGATPAMGGPESRVPEQEHSGWEALRDLGQLEAELKGRYRKLSTLEALLEGHALLRRPSMEPVREGWIGTPYGERLDPVTGEPYFHEGLDFSSRLGSAVLATADGLVTFSGESHGYGKMVEVDHGSGLATRYGHNVVNLVEAGERVAMGQIIARVGRGGRAVHPHVYYQVFENGYPVDPSPYLRPAASTR